MYDRNYAAISYWSTDEWEFTLSISIPGFSTQEEAFQFNYKTSKIIFIDNDNNTKCFVRCDDGSQIEIPREMARISIPIDRGANRHTPVNISFKELFLEMKLQKLEGFIQVPGCHDASANLTGLSGMTFYKQALKRAYKDDE